MSFILEALKKSEKNRQESSVPTLDTLHEATEQPRKRPLWPLMMMAVLIVNAAILLWLFGPWQSDEQTVMVEQPSTVTTTVAAVTTPQQLTTQLEAPVAVTQQTAAPLPPAQPVAASAAGTQLTAPAAPQAIPVVAEPVSIATAPVATLPADVTAPAEPAKPAALAINELPINIQNQLPHLHMSVHAYNGNANSLIRLNDKIMRQGSFLDGRYRLEEITPDGAIFSNQGYRFLVPRKGR